MVTIERVATGQWVPVNDMTDDSAMKYVPTIGLEVHVQLRTVSKMFCACSTEFGAEPNTHVCPVCLGYPGAMPVMNGRAIELTVRTGLMIGSEISRFSKFDRKSYFYPDMPKNYQISQYDKPLCLGGEVEADDDGRLVRVRIHRIHLEEDVAKNMHFQSASGIDFNRAGTPLMEIVTEPEMHSAADAYAFLQALKQIVAYAGVSDCNLEEGNIRCDVNVSVCPESQSELGTKAEIKNMNTFKGVHSAVGYEIERQVALLEGGGRVIQETRRWDPDRELTSSMRIKEDEHDYRYFPEPDLMPVVLDPQQVSSWRESLPEAPRARRDRMVAAYGIPDYDAGVLAAERSVADFFEAAAKASSNPKAISNWIMTEMLRLLSEANVTIEAVPVTPKALAGLVALVDAGSINSNTAKDIFAELFEKGGDPETIVKEKGLLQVSDADAIGAFADQAISENSQSVEDYRGGKKAALQFLVGQVMRLSRGKANPQMVAKLLAEKMVN